MANASTRVFSWKITDNKYGYLYIPDKVGNGFISDRITEEDKLSRIASEVSSWSQNEYEEKFNSLNELIRSKYGVTIPGSAADYCEGYTKNYIILSGKDGSSKQIEEKELNNFIIQNVKKAFDESFRKAKIELKAEVDNVKDATIGKFDEKVRKVDEDIDAAKNDFDVKNTILSNKLISATTHIEKAAQLFDFDTSGVTKESLTRTINKAEAATLELINTNSKISALSGVVETTRESVQEFNTTTNNLQTNINNLATSVDNRFIEYNSTLSELDARISDVEREEREENNGGDEEVLGKSTNRSMSFADSENIIDNNDGTYTLRLLYGNEVYNIKIMGFGNYLKEDEVENGFTIANNGFRYVDKGGAQISMVNGNIVLSNASGKGKLEIKEDGVYINGKIQ